MKAPSYLRAAAQGLMLGEAISWTGLYHRSQLLPFWTRRKRREIEAQYEQDTLVELSLPFALNQPPDMFEPAPGIHAEWFAFQLNVIQRSNGYESANAFSAWRDLLKQRETLRLTISQHAALMNIAQGKVPPISGYDNPHYFDDSACFRAIPLAVLLAGDKEALIKTVTEDASISQAKDGVWAACAYAVLLGHLIETKDVEAGLALALKCLPESSWSQKVIEAALAAAEKANTLFELLHYLAHNVINDAYNYGNSAPETLAISMAILAFTGGAVETSFLAALALAKTTGSVAPLVGAVCGVLNTDEVEAAMVFSTSLIGVSLPQFEGVDLLRFIDDWERN